MAEEIKTRREGSNLAVLLSSLAIFGFLQLVMFSIMLLFIYSSDMQIPYFIWFYPTIIVLGIMSVVIISTLVFTLAIGLLRLACWLLEYIVRKRLR